MKKAILAIGIPGAGKTTLLTSLAGESSARYLAADDLRQELYGDASYQGGNRRVWEELFGRAAQALSAGESVIIDGTFANPAERREALARLGRMGAERRVGVFVNTPVAVARARNRMRERQVRVPALYRMAKRLREDPPALTDGFEELLEYDEEQRLVRRESRSRAEDSQEPADTLY